MRSKNEKLLCWLKKATDEEITKTGTTRSYLKAIGYGYKTAGAEIAVSVERVTAGVIGRKDLRQDWVDIWPELVASNAIKSAA